MRRIPEEIIKLGESLKIEMKANAERITQTRSYKLITPLFGGGVAPRENDESKLIRETQIRGQLRFWWRAIRGTGTLVDIKQREDAIFGSANQKVGQSKVLTSVKVNENHKIDSEGKFEQIFESKTRTVITREKDWSKLAYASFQLQPDDGKQFYVRDGIEFSLDIIFPESERAEIEAALWAWETFGGIGGRTRRGFGSIKLLNIKENAKAIAVERYKVATVEAEIKRDLKTHLLRNKICDKNMPHLTFDSVFKIKKADNPQRAWESLIEKYKEFRQVRDFNSETRRPSRNKWSEPDEIRRIYLAHNPRARLGHETIRNIDKFPRGDFGLPIVFHFQRDERIENDFTLNAKNYERLASPLILRPISCEDGAISLALILQTTRASEIELMITSGRNIKDKAVSRLDKSEAVELTNRGLTPLDYKIDVLQAFLDFFANDDANNRNENNRNNQRRNY